MLPASGKPCGNAGIRPSLGSGQERPGKKLLAALEGELLARRRFASRAEAQMVIFTPIKAWQGPARLHSPMTREREQRQVATAEPYSAKPRAGRVLARRHDAKDGDARTIVAGLPTEGLFR
ncbi:hypothetical protein [Roseicella aerolata]|uniref:Uncharacterized protein n=1 Tax=Roseicella aerolata TaxID=2883479 RepID=A0A9X1LDZ2_9PROT|nr:hypothetical protein [Roseicella aerolata]MCB4825607.1 hypothetical protein [Roseicella aerolata]